MNLYLTLIYFWWLILVHMYNIISNFFWKNINILCISNKKSFSILLLCNRKFLCHIFKIFWDNVNLFLFIGNNILFLVIRHLSMHFFDPFFIGIIFHISIIFWGLSELETFNYNWLMVKTSLKNKKNGK